MGAEGIYRYTCHETRLRKIIDRFILLVWIRRPWSLRYTLRGPSLGPGPVLDASATLANEGREVGRYEETVRQGPHGWLV